jgi:hypothetical protein
VVAVVAGQEPVLVAVLAALVLSLLNGDFNNGSLCRT